MEDVNRPGFGSLEEELEYWKDQAARNKQRFGPAFVSKPFFSLNVWLLRKMFNSTDGCFGLGNVLFVFCERKK